MSVDKFGRTVRDHNASKKFRMELLHHQKQLAYTKDGDFDLENRRLCNVKAPKNPPDCATKQYTDLLVEEVLSKKTNQLTESSILPLEAKIKKLEETNSDAGKQLAEINAFVSRTLPEDEKHMATKKYVDETIFDLKKTTSELNEKIKVINTFITRSPPIAGKHMATKKYVDEAIVVTKHFLRKEVDSLLNKFRTELLAAVEVKMDEKLEKKIV